MQNSFQEFEELVFFDLLIPDSRFQFQDSGFPVLGFATCPEINWIEQRISKQTMQ